MAGMMHILPMQSSMLVNTVHAFRFAALSRLCILLEHHNVHLDYTNHCRIFMNFRGSSEVQMDAGFEKTKAKIYQTLLTWYKMIQMISKTHDDTPILFTAFQLSTNDRNPVESLPSSLESAGLIGRAAPSCQGNCPVGSNASKLRCVFFRRAVWHS